MLSAMESIGRRVTTQAIQINKCNLERENHMDFSTGRLGALSAGKWRSLFANAVFHGARSARGGPLPFYFVG
jgi:hypothetical protein